jgi:hypothetical protein
MSAPKQMNEAQAQKRIRPINFRTVEVKCWLVDGSQKSAVESLLHCVDILYDLGSC